VYYRVYRSEYIGYARPPRSDRGPRTARAAPEPDRASVACVVCRRVSWVRSAPLCGAAAAGRRVRRARRCGGGRRRRVGSGDERAPCRARRRRCAVTATALRARRRRRRPDQTPRRPQATRHDPRRARDTASWTPRPRRRRRARRARARSEPRRGAIKRTVLGTGRTTAVRYPYGIAYTVLCRTVAVGRVYTVRNPDRAASDPSASALNVMRKGACYSRCMKEPGRNSANITLHKT
jgi:hypothetical protein